MSRKHLVLMSIAILAFGLLVGCGSDGNDEDGSRSGDSVTAASNCAPEQLQTFKSGVLTIATDSPAYEPYFEEDDPTNGRGFESALGYAIAAELGFNDSQVQWVTVPFEEAWAPGMKSFDFDLNQVSITPDREKNVAFSVPYYRASQAALVKEGGGFDEIARLEGLADARIGVQAGTTSLDAVNELIEPKAEPLTFDDSEGVVSAFRDGQLDAIVVDLPTAIALRDELASNPVTVLAGQFESDGGDEWGAVMPRDSELKPCVDQAIENLKENGTLEELTNQWMRDSADAPTLD